MNSGVIAIRNVKKSFKDYSVYFLTIIIGVTLFYVFNSIGSQSAMMRLSSDQRVALLGIDAIMGTLSVFVSVVLGFLILYANAFLIRRRKKEMALYLILGMKKKRVFSILLFETLFVGLFSMVIGLVFGILLSQGFSLVTAKLFGLSVSRFAFVVSGKAVIKSIVYFGIIFVMVVLLNVIRIGRNKLIDLIYADRKISSFKKPRLFISVVLFVVSIGFIGVAYYLMLHEGIRGFVDPAGRRLQAASIALGLSGTFLFFFSMSGFFLALISRLKGIYLKKLNLFTLRQFDSQIHIAYTSITMVCLLLFLSISAISIGGALTVVIRQYRVSETASSIGIAYISFYIGIVFLITCASVLAVAKLSEASDSQPRYELLSRLGANDRMIAHSIFFQIVIYFAAPLILAIAHSIVAIKTMSSLILAFGKIDIFSTSLMTGAFVIAVYGCYLWMTYRNALRLARG